MRRLCDLALAHRDGSEAAQARVFRHGLVASVGRQDAFDAQRLRAGELLGNAVELGVERSDAIVSERELPDRDVSVDSEAILAVREGPLRDLELDARFVDVETSFLELFGELSILEAKECR